ncbi:MAG: SDR family NAD(P)-dependent oxidoreductase [Arenicellales bacterium]
MYQETIKRGGIAVVTGSANGVGRVAAIRFAQAGLDVVLADLSGDALNSALQEVRDAATPDAKVIAIPTDVSDAKSVNALADAVFAAGEVAVLMNNAGIARPCSSWAQADNWRQVIEVNLFGVLNCVQAFLPRMTEANRPAVVINTGSKQGFTNPPGNAGYNTSKAAVKTMSEMLVHELRIAEAPISVHLFVPGFTYTNMIASFMPEKPAAAWTSEQTVDYFLERMAAGDFYVLCPDNEVNPERDRRRLEWSMQDVILNRPALSRWHPDFKEEFGEFENFTEGSN